MLGSGGQSSLPPGLFLPPASELDILGAPRLIAAASIKVGVVSGEPRLLHQLNAHPRHARSRYAHDMLSVGAGRGLGGRGGGRLVQERVTPLAHHRGRPPLCHCLLGKLREGQSTTATIIVPTAPTIITITTVFVVSKTEITTTKVIHQLNCPSSYYCTCTTTHTAITTPITLLSYSQQSAHTKRRSGVVTASHVCVSVCVI